MKTKVHLQLYLNELTEQERNLLISLREKSVSIQKGTDKEEKSFVNVHLCGHDENKACKNHEVL